MTPPAKETLQPEQEDYDTRFKVVEPGFSNNQDQMHEEALAFLRKELKNGKSWKQASKNLGVEDKAFKAVILDDFLKITLAERHFQSGQEIKEIARTLQVPVPLLLAIKEDMIREVKEASIRAYHLSQPAEKQSP